MMLWGSIGIGKFDIIQQIGDDENLQSVDPRFFFFFF